MTPAINLQASLAVYDSMRVAPKAASKFTIAVTRLLWEALASLAWPVKIAAGSQDYSPRKGTR